jgi:integrase/recombinase XerD
LFPQRQKTSAHALLDLVKHYARIAGIEKKVTTHTFRHSCATHMLKGGADIRFVQKMLGHKQLSTTERYLKIEITDLKEVLERCHPREREEW